MIAAAVVFAYLAVVLYIGIFAFRTRAAARRRGLLPGRPLARAGGVPAVAVRLEHDGVLDPRRLGPRLRQRHRHLRPDGVLVGARHSGLRCSCIGTRLWALGKRHGFMTPVQMFRDRWECGHIGTVIFAVQAVLLVPYIIIAVMGGGTTLRTVSNGAVPFWLGGAIVSLVVMSYVFLGGMRGTAWVNAFQTVLFLLFGAIAVVGGRRRHGRLQPGDGVDARVAGHGAAADARAGLAAVLPQLHLHPAVVDRVSAHRASSA